MCGILWIAWWSDSKISDHYGMTDADHPLHQFDRHMVWAGFIQLAPISLFVATRQTRPTTPAG